jgi:type I restriction enzyme S subunit
MNRELLLKHFDRISEAPDAIPRLRRFILDLAVRGKLLEQDPADRPEPVLLALLNRPLHDQSTHLPSNWIESKLGTLLTFQYGKGIAANDRLECGRVALFGSNGIVGYCENALCEDGVIVIGRKGSAGALTLSEGPSWTTDVAYYVVPPPFLDIHFLFLSLQTLGLDTLGKGVKPGLSRGDAYQLTLRVPPLAEQQRIVAKVDELMALCDQLEATQTEREHRRDRLVAASLHSLNNGSDAEAFREHARFYLNHLPRLTARPEHLKQLRETILNSAARGRLVLQDPDDEPATKLLARIHTEKARLAKDGLISKFKPFPAGAATSDAEVPESWQSVQLGDMCSLVTSGSRGWAEFYSETGPKFIRAQNIRFGRLRLDDLACVTPPQNAEGSRTQVAQGDLLIVITGAGVTNPALLDQGIGEAYVSQHVALIRPVTTDVSRWLLLCLMAPVAGRAILVERAYGAGKPGLNLDNIRSLKIPIPPLAEQRRIIAKVDELMALCNRLEAQITTTKGESRRLLDAVLHEALNPAATAEAA